METGVALGLTAAHFVTAAFQCYVAVLLMESVNCQVNRKEYKCVRFHPSASAYSLYLCDQI
jgi:hypothetical protein